MLSQSQKQSLNLRVLYLVAGKPHQGLPVYDLQRVSPYCCQTEFAQFPCRPTDMRRRDPEKVGEVTALKREVTPPLALPTKCASPIKYFQQKMTKAACRGGLRIEGHLAIGAILILQKGIDQSTCETWLVGEEFADCGTAKNTQRNAGQAGNAFVLQSEQYALQSDYAPRKQDLDNLSFAAGCQAIPECPSAQQRIELICMPTGLDDDRSRVMLNLPAFEGSDKRKLFRRMLPEMRQLSQRALRTADKVHRRPCGNSKSLWHSPVLMTDRWHTERPFSIADPSCQQIARSTVLSPPTSNKEQSNDEE